jgi:hypothetical protein
LETPRNYWPTALLIALGAALLFAPVVAVFHIYAEGELPTLVVRRGGWHWFRETEPPWTRSAFKSWTGYYLLAGSGLIVWVFAASTTTQRVSVAIALGASKAFIWSLGALGAFLVLRELVFW